MNGAPNFIALQNATTEILDVVQNDGSKEKCWGSEGFDGCW
jgi:hypothetical protein